jgi:hypothetical protein
MPKLRNPVMPESLGKQLLMKCMICQKDCEGWYGRWQDTGTCSKKCEQVQAAKYPYPGHSADEFWQRVQKLS